MTISFKVCSARHRWFITLLFSCFVFAFIHSTIAQETDAPSEAAPDNPPLLRVGIKEAMPFSFKNDSGVWQGISVALWQDIARTVGIDYEFIELPLADMLSGVSTSELDAAIGALTVTVEREEILDFTHGFYNTGFSIATQPKQAGVLSLVRAFLDVNFLKTLAVLCLCLLIAGTLVWLAERKANAEEFGGRTGVGAGFWWAAVTMTTVGYGDKSPKTLLGRTVALLWMFISLGIIGTFLASMASAITLDSLRSTVSGPQDLPNVRVATVKGSSSETYLQELRVRRLLTYDDLETALTHLTAGTADAVVYDDPLIQFLVFTKPELSTITTLPDIFEPQQYAFALTTDNPLREEINRALIGIISTPQWQEVLTQYLGE